MEFHLFEIYYFSYDKIQTQQNNQKNALSYILSGFDISDSLINKDFGNKSPLIKTSAWRRLVSFSYFRTLEGRTEVNGGNNRESDYKYNKK